MKTKSDRIRFETWVEIESIREKKDIKENTYYQFVSSKGTRLLCWDFDIFEPLQQEINDEATEKHLLKGFVNIVHGGTFLVVDKDYGTRAKQIRESIKSTVKAFTENECADEYRGTGEDEVETLPY